MAWILVAVGSLLLLVAYLSAPEEYTAHASREKPFAGSRPMGRRLPLFRGLTLKSGEKLAIARDTVVVRVDGDSFEDSGIADGSTVIATRIAADEAAMAAAQLKDGDIVVIDGPGQYESGLRFRKFDHLAGEMMHFKADKKGPTNPRPASQLWARVALKEVV